MDPSKLIANDGDVRKTIFRANIDSSLTISMVEYVDGRLGIHRNGAAIAMGPWNDSELCECVNTFQKVSRAAAIADGNG